MMDFIVIAASIWILIGTLMGIVNLFGYEMAISRRAIKDGDKYLNPYMEMIKDALRGPLVVAFPMWEERYYKNKLKDVNNG